MLSYQRFFKAFGIRRITDLNDPVINRLEDIVLPRDSIYHYLPEDTVVSGIPSDHWAIKNAERLVMVEHITELAPNLKMGSPRKASVQPLPIIKAYHTRHRKLKLAKDIQRSTRDSKTYLVANYALLPQLYNYTKSMYSSYHRKENLIQTLWYNVEQLSEQLDRHNFITVELPDRIPPLTLLRRVEDEGLTTSLLEEFSSLNELMILDIWRWLGEFRDQSLLSDMSQKAIDRTDIIFKRNNRWFVINLGLIDDWRDGVVNEGDLGPKALQKRFLKLLITLFESVTLSAGNTVAINEVADVVNAKETTKDQLEDTYEPVNNTEVKKVLKKTDKDEDLEEELDALQKIADDEKAEQEKDIFTDEEVELKDAVLDKAEELAQNGDISAAEFKRYQALANSHESIPNPYTGKGSIMEAITIKPEDLEIKEPEKFADRATVVDKSMLESTIGVFDKKYTQEILPKDIAGSVMNLTRAGVPVTDYEVETVEDVANAYQIHTVRVSPIGGKRSTLSFKVPVIADDGTFTANGIKYRMRKQRGDMPVRKTNATTVALTSYYGKVFVKRSTKVVHDYGAWLTKQIKLINLDNEDERISDLKTADDFDLSIKLPKLYTALGTQFKSFKSKGITFYFDYSTRQEFFKIDKLSAIEKRGMVVIGKQGKTFLLVDDNDAIYKVSDKDLEVVGSIEDILELDKTKAPVETAELKVFSANIPLGFVLAYYNGIDRLIKSLGGTVKRVPSSEKLQLTGEEYAIRFEDETLVVNREDKLTSLVLSGFNNYKKSIKRFSIHDFNKKEIFFNVLDDFGLGVRQLRELDLLKDMFVDPITLEILKDLKLPTTWLGLLKYSAELLLTDYTLRETDLSEMRIKGYERIAGAVYLELVNSMRGYRGKGGIGNASIDLNPYAVWKTINEDPSVTISEESNPIKNINEKEAVTFMGVGGRSRDSMVGRTRVYEQNDMGTISEATVDSGDVAINTYTTANPKLKNLRGVTERYNSKEDGAASLMSTAALLSPAADMDDSKRVNFITIQHAQGISAKGYQVSPLRTGYEQVVADRTDDLYATTAKQKGKVIAVNKKAITVEYADGTQVSVQLGRRFGSAAGSVYPHSVVSDLEKGDLVNVGDSIAYNENYFSPDPLNNKQVLWKGGVLAKTAILESSDTFEDSSAISTKLAKELGSDITKVRHVFVNFDQSVKNLVKVGDKLDPDSILCTIEDAVTSENNLFTDDNIETLKLLSGNAPKAKYGGVVEKVEILYYGDKEDMSSTLSELVTESDKELAKERRALGKKVVSGAVEDSLRIDNKNLELDSAVIKIYLTKEESAGTGDKGVFGNQMKTIFGRVMEGTNETESGTPIDALFSYQSIANRVVLSPEVMGTTNTLLRVLSKHVADAYFED